MTITTTLLVLNRYIDNWLV